MLSEPLAYDTTVKLNMTHNVSSVKMAELRFDVNMTVFQVKLQVEKKYGSDASHVSLILQDKAGNTLHKMSNDGAYLRDYAPKDGYNIHVIDSNPNSVLKGLDDLSKVPKFTLTDEQYNKLPNNFRKFKEQVINPQLEKVSTGPNDSQPVDDDFEKDIALTINVGQRCKLNNGDHRGVVRYVGHIPQMGLGYFVGVQLDEPFGLNNGSIKGYIYFLCPAKYGIFVRPSELVVGDFPEVDLDDEM